MPRPVVVRAKGEIANSSGTLRFEFVGGHGHITYFGDLEGPEGTVVRGPLGLEFTDFGQFQEVLKEMVVLNVEWDTIGRKLAAACGYCGSIRGTERNHEGWEACVDCQGV